MNEQDKKTSDQLVRLIQIIFGFVLAQSIGRYEEVVLNPFNRQHLIAAFALVTIFITAVLSWIDWHVTMNLRPYSLNPKNKRRFFDEARVFADMLIVIAYAYILLTIGIFSREPTADISLYIRGYFFIFLGYLISGFLRKLTYGPVASRLPLIIVFAIVYPILAVVYKWMRNEQYLDQKGLNLIAIILVLATMIAYRLIRRNLRTKMNSAKQNGLRIGFDVDGVLANQIVGVLPRVKRRLGVSIKYEDITDWRLPIGESSIDKEIILAMEDPDYVLGMPLHPYVRETITGLYRNNIIKVITSRPPSAEEWTQLWINKHGIPVDSLNSVKEIEKSLFTTDILIDDYINNIKEFLTTTAGFAFLVDQPWNQSRDDLSLYIQKRRLRIIKSLQDLPNIVREIKDDISKQLDKKTQK